MSRVDPAPFAVPALFVLLWSTGFIGARLGLPHAEPLTFLALRYAVVLAVLAPLALILRATWPATLRDARHIAVAGLLIQGGYLGGVFSAVHAGMSAGIVALIVGMQPLLTAAFGFCTAGLLLSAGMLYQKRHCPLFDARAGATIQFGAALAVTLPLAWALETMQVRWSGEFVFALGWLSLVLSVGATTLLFRLIARGTATRVTSLFYLTPAVTAVMAWLMFDDTLGAVALAGMAIAVAGEALVNRSAPPPADNARSA